MKFLFVLVSSLFLFIGFSFAWEMCGEEINSFDDSRYNQLMLKMQEVVPLSNQASDMFKIGDVLSAVEKLEMAYSICPQSSFKTRLASYYETLGYGYLVKEEYNKSIEYYNKYSEFVSDTFSSLYNIGTAYHNLNQLDTALKYYEKALNITFNSKEIEIAKKRLDDIKEMINISKKTVNNSNNLIDNELSNSISWMYNNGLTKFTEPTSFMSDNGLRRDEATKFFVQYAKEVMGMVPDTTKTSCNFTDLNQARPDLKDLIKESCQLGLFQGHKGKFMPTQKLTNAEAITVFIRLVDGYKDETGSHFVNEYYNKAKGLGLLDDLNLNSQSKFDSYTTRGEVSRMLFRGKDKK